MRAPLAVIVVAAALAGGCFSAIGDGQVRCGVNGECPTSFNCNATDGKCYRAPAGGCVSLHCLIGWCGPISDGCGHMIDCGSCFPSDGGDKIVDMRGSAVPDLAPCVATSPCTPGVCGTLTDRCGSPQVCGDCMPPGRCSANIAHACTCTPKMAIQCLTLGIHCGKYPDGCGGTIDCGSCNHGENCGAGGPYTCGLPTNKCTPITSCPTGVCGMTPDGCAGVFNCPTPCGAGQICGGGGTANRCG